jgi:hypothetical protein
MSERLVLATLAAVFLAVGGCATASQPSAPSVDVSGVWTGITIASQITLPVRLDLQQAGAVVTGTVSIAGYAPGSGTVAGTVAGNEFTYRTASGVGADLVVNGDEMAGTGTSGSRMTFRRQR